MSEAFLCARCPSENPSSGVFFPRLRYHCTLEDGTPRNLYMTLHMAVCDAHRTPFVDQVLRLASESPLGNPEGQIRDAFFRRHHCYPQDVYTRVDWLGVEHPDIQERLRVMKELREKRPEHERRLKLAVEYVTDEDMIEIMASAPDIAMPLQ